MTYDTQATNPAPPMGDVQPVPVHVVADSSKGGAAPAKHRKTLTRFSTYVLTSTNPIQSILPTDEDRLRAVVIVHSTVGSAAAQGSYGWLAQTQGAAQAAAGDHGEQSNEGAAYISAGGTINVPFEFRGTGPVWAALDNAASSSMALTVISDYME